MSQQKYISDEQVVKRAMDVPIFTYDRETQSICVIGSDGSKTQVCGRYNHGRYSERVK